MSFLNASDLHRIFQELDKNGDGLISVDQLQWLLEKIGSDQTSSTVDELRELVGGRQILDPIDFHFFYDIVIKNQCIQSGVNEASDSDSDDDLSEAFKVFDLNGDGFISCQELEFVLSRFGLWDEKNGQDCQIMINKYDRNSDGVLDFEEFKFMMLLSDSN